MKYVKIYLLIILMSVVAAFGVYTFFPWYKPQLLEEDRLVENLSAIIFLLVFITGLLFHFKSEKRRKTLLLLSSLGLLGFLDELSFGQRIYGFQIPVVLSVGIDAVHDFFRLGFIIFMQIADSYPVYLYSFIVLGIIIMITITEYIYLLRYRNL